MLMKSHLRFSFFLAAFPVPVFLMTEEIHLVSSLAYRNTIISDKRHGSLIGGIQWDEGTHFPYIPAHPVEVSGIMDSIKANVPNTWVALCMEFIFIVKTPEVSLIGILSGSNVAGFH
jgi:hypothetical protein